MEELKDKEFERTISEVPSVLREHLFSRRIIT
jgi:hypothetical protein